MLYKMLYKMAVMGRQVFAWKAGGGVDSADLSSTKAHLGFTL